MDQLPDCSTTISKKKGANTELIFGYGNSRNWDGRIGKDLFENSDTKYCNIDRCTLTDCSGPKAKYTGGKVSMNRQSVISIPQKTETGFDKPEKLCVACANR